MDALNGKCISNEDGGIRFYFCMGIVDENKSEYVLCIPSSVGINAKFE